MNEKVKINIPAPCPVLKSDPIPPGDYIAESIIGGQAVVLIYNGDKYMIPKRYFKIIDNIQSTTTP